MKSYIFVSGLSWLLETVPFNSKLFLTYVCCFRKLFYKWQNLAWGWQIYFDICLALVSEPGNRKNVYMYVMVALIFFFLKFVTLTLSCGFILVKNQHKFEADWSAFRGDSREPKCTRNKCNIQCPHVWMSTATVQQKQECQSVILSELAAMHDGKWTEWHGCHDDCPWSI